MVTTRVKTTIVFAHRLDVSRIFYLSVLQLSKKYEIFRIDNHEETYDGFKGQMWAYHQDSSATDHCDYFEIEYQW